MAIAVSDRAVAEIKKAAGARATTPEGAARRHPRRRLHRLLLPVRVVGQEPRAEDKVLAFEDGAVRVFVDPKSYIYLDGSTLEYADHDDGPGLQVQEPERERDVRLRRERPVLRRPVMICWSCQHEAGTAPLCAACGALQPPDDGADLFAVLGLPARYRGRSGGGGGRVQGLSRQVHPDRFATADPRARRASLARTVQLNDAWRTLKDPVRRAEYLLARAGIDIGEQAADARRRGEATTEVAAPPAFLIEILELNDELARGAARGRRGRRSRSWPRRCGRARATR